MADREVELPATTPDLGRQAARGALLTLGGQGVRMALQIVAVVVLARLLEPRDYGLFAMVLAVVGVGEIFRDFGLSSAAVQARSLSRRQRDNLFWINTLIGTCLAAITYAAAVPLAALYDEPALVDVARALAVAFVLNGAATQFRADLVRRLRFRSLAVADVIAPAVGLAVAVTTALTGWGVWALVAQSLTQSLVLLLALVLAAGWLPGRPHRRENMRGLLRFGWHLVATQLVGYAANNVDSLLIGLRFGAAPLGIYSRAFQLLMTPLSQLRAPTTTVALPVLSRLSDDEQRYGQFLCRGQLALGYTLVCGLAVVAGAAGPVTELFLGERWASVTPLLRLLAIAGGLQTLSYVGYWVYLSRGLTGALLRYSLVTAAIKIGCVVVGSTWGVVGVAAGYALAPALAWPLSLWWLSRRTALPVRALLAGGLRVLLVAAAVASSAALTTAVSENASAALQVAYAVGAAPLVLSLTALLSRAVRDDLRGVVDIARAARRVPAPR